MLVIDLTDFNALKSVSGWLNEVNRYMSSSNRNIVLIGNKVDIKENRQIENETMKEYADSLDIQYLETSAKDGTNVNIAFRTIAKKYLEQTIAISNITYNNVIKLDIKKEISNKNKCLIS